MDVLVLGTEQKAAGGTLKHTFSGALTATTHFLIIVKRMVTYFG